MNERAKCLLAAVFTLVAARSWAAGGSFTDGAVTLTYPPTHWSALPEVTLLGTEPSPTANPIVEMGWWYRAEGDTREYPLPAPDSEAYFAGGLFAHWNNIDGKGFSADAYDFVFDNEGPSGAVWSGLWVQNDSATPKSLAIFHYLDPNAAGTGSDDGAVLLADRYIKITDGSTGAVIRYRAYPGTTHYQASAHSALRDALNDGGPTELNDGGLPFGPGDFTAAYEWSETLAPGNGMGGEVSVSSRLPSDHLRAAYLDIVQLPGLITHDAVYDAFGLNSMRRTTFFRGLVFGIPPDLELLALDDLDGDFADELVTRDPVTGVTRVNLAPITGASGPPPNWKLAGTGDFDHDGRADLFWRNTTSQKLAVWLMDGSAKVGNMVPNPDHAVNADWRAAGVADFDGDGNLDLLWQNQTSGNVVIWYMDAALQRITGAFTNPPAAGSNWRVVAVGDYGRGAGGAWNTADIVWQNQISSKVVVWFMDHAGDRTSGVFTTPDSFGAMTEVIGPR